MNALACQGQVFISRGALGARAVARPKPLLEKLHQLTPGQYADFFALLLHRTKNTTREGKPFYTCRFTDGHRLAAFVAWSDGKWFESCEREWQEGKFYKLRGSYAEHEKYGPQIDLENIRPVTDADRADGFDASEFVEHSRFDAEAMFAELRGIAEEQIADLPLRRLVLTILDRHAEALKRLPATLDKFYPFCGGLLEHLLSVTHTCLRLVEKYAAHYRELVPPLNRDLVVAGAMLHDIGRVLEYDGDVVAPQPTVEGRLFGHLFLGRDLVRDTARELGDVNPELVRLLEHILIAHLALPEWGSPRLPLVPECLIIHHADDLDAKLEMYVRCLSRDRAAGAFTARDPVLNRQLFKGRTV
jgi:3'-5' exoribonuclease